MFGLQGSETRVEALNPDQGEPQVMRLLGVSVLAFSLLHRLFYFSGLGFGAFFADDQERPV